MEYSYRYQVRISDLWQASMYYAYSSYMGMVNLVCIAASIALIVSRWKGASDPFKAAMVLFLMLFTVIQPVMIWMKARAAAGAGRPKLELTFARNGIHVVSDGRIQDVKWQRVRSIVKKPTIVLLYMDDGAGYILRNSTLGKTRDEFYQFAKNRIQENRTPENR
ncbi:MAG: YcxB family protein [Lachnospiraceae bacterium]|nr:YcxB family protein [Lachnospiraceae bacterium]